MVAIAAITFVVLVIAAAVILLGLRRWTLDEGRAEARLRSPETHKVVYAVPDGQDPASVMAALMHAGFTSVVGMEEGIEQLLIECEETDRARVRRLIEGVSRATSEEHRLAVDQVRFEDEVDRQS
jgi:hypothetical protein